ncbi:hypothetical protein GCM10010388_36080 [Streptomyces mauvecolor]
MHGFPLGKQHQNGQRQRITELAPLGRHDPHLIPEYSWPNISRLGGCVKRDVSRVGPGGGVEFGEVGGAVWPCLGSALWALRTTGSFERALGAAVDLGGDTDTVAAVTGGLAGACYGLPSIPARWTTPLHVPLPGFGDRVLGAAELDAMARELGAGSGA